MTQIQNQTLLLIFAFLLFLRFYIFLIKYFIYDFILFYIVRFFLFKQYKTGLKSLLVLEVSKKKC